MTDEFIFVENNGWKRSITTMRVDHQSLKFPKKWVKPIKSMKSSDLRIHYKTHQSPDWRFSERFSRNAFVYFAVNKFTSIEEYYVPATFTYTYLCTLRHLLITYKSEWFTYWLSFFFLVFSPYQRYNERNMMI